MRIERKRPPLNISRVSRVKHDTIFLVRKADASKFLLLVVSSSSSTQNGFGSARDVGVTFDVDTDGDVTARGNGFF